MRPRLPPATKQALTEVLLSLFKDIPYMITVCGTVFGLAGSYFPFFFLQLNAVVNGVDENLAFHTLAILNGASVFGRVVPNAFVARFGPFNVMIPCVVACAILLFCTLAVKTAAAAVIFAALYGLFSGGCIGVILPLLASLAQNDKEIGARMGFYFTFAGIGGLVGNPIAGALLTSHLYWYRPIIFAASCITAAGFAFSATRFLVARKKGTQLLWPDPRRFPVVKILEKNSIDLCHVMVEYMPHAIGTLYFWKRLAWPVIDEEDALFLTSGAQ